MSKEDKTALVLAGGGLTGAVYHIGALRAIDDLLVDRTVNDFDVFVGTSAGSLICSLLASGFTPDEMLKTIDGRVTEFEAIERQHIFAMNKSDLIEWGAQLPLKAINLGYKYFSNFGDMTLFDLIWNFTEVLPPGLYNSLGLERYVRRLLDMSERSNHFDQVEKELFIIATDLDTGDRAVFGRGYDTETSISTAVAASSALPLLYKPVRIGNHEYVDGGIRGNASLDLAIEQGATLVVCINPMVPFDNSNRAFGSLTGSKTGYLSEKGIRFIADQTLRIASHSGLEYQIKQLRRRHPEVDIILIEPRPDDFQMFFYNIMRYSARLTVAQHGFESVTVDLAEEYPRYKATLARHGIPISRRLVIEELAEIHKSGYDENVIRRVLEARSSACNKRRQHWPTCKLNDTLAELALVLDDFMTGAPV